jgi:hypothetical protein
MTLENRHYDTAYTTLLMDPSYDADYSLKATELVLQINRNSSLSSDLRLPYPSFEYIYISNTFPKIVRVIKEVDKPEGMANDTVEIPLSRGFGSRKQRYPREISLYHTKLRVIICNILSSSGFAVNN